MHILLAEDHPMNRRLAARMLERLGHTVTAVTNGREVLDTLASTAGPGPAFDVILLDLRMPVMDGFEAARRLPGLGLPVPPIIAFTADVTPEVRAACQDLGMHGFLAKPIDLSTLQAVLAEVASDGRVDY